MKFINIILTTLIFSASVFAQNETEIVRDLEKIYGNLEYNTTAFNDLKQQWIINDPVLIRDIYNKFVVKDALRMEGDPVPFETIKEKSQQIYDGNIEVFLRKRYYDDEIEYFAFMQTFPSNKSKSHKFFDPVTDGFYLKDVVGKKLYEKLQGQNYHHSNVTKTQFNKKPGYYFDINLNLLNPEVMFWSSTSRERNKYLLSFFGKWGEDKIYLPGWNLGEYIGGFKVTYYRAINGDPKNYTYSFYAGIGAHAGKPLTGILNQPQTPVYKPGYSAYLKLSGNPFKIFADKTVDYFFMDAEGSIALTDYDRGDFINNNVKIPADFYSIKNYYSVSLKKKKLFSLFDFGMFEIGANYAAHDLYHLDVDGSQKEPAVLEPERISSSIILGSISV